MRHSRLLILSSASVMLASVTAWAQDIPERINYPKYEQIFQGRDQTARQAESVAQRYLDELNARIETVRSLETEKQELEADVSTSRQSIRDGEQYIADAKNNIAVKQ